MRKKEWSKPKLIVLIKGRPEEMSLSGCKGGGGYSWFGVSGCVTFDGTSCNPDSSMFFT